MVHTSQISKALESSVLLISVTLLLVFLLAAQPMYKVVHLIHVFNSKILENYPSKGD